MQTLVFDIETIPDEARIPTWKSVKCPKCDHDPKNHPRQKKDYCAECNDKFALKWPTSQVISFTAKLDGNLITFCDSDERSVLDRAYKLINDHRSYTFVVFNGQDFDIPVLRMRGMLLNIPLISVLPRGRYPKNLIDVYLELTEGKFNKDQAASLEMIATMLGYKDLLYGNGSQVSEWYKSNQLDEIAKHNQGDVLALEAIYNHVLHISERYNGQMQKEPANKEKKKLVLLS